MTNLIKDTYKTLTAPSSGLYKEKGSKFIARAFPAYTEDETKEILESVKKEFHDARHHVYAYMLGTNREQYRANDDGEPANSSGKPILGQIESYKLTNIMIIVVRYFGGVKLGVGGLINAYRTAAKEAIESGKIVEKKVKCYFDIYFDYPAMNDVMKYIKDQNIKVDNQDFGLNCKISVNCRNQNSKLHIESFEAINNVNKVIITKTH